jgi:HPt (histidine-containing phosphotransfer) domain-containing protein
VTGSLVDAKVIASLEELEKASGAPLLVALIEAFLGDAPRRLAALEDALARGDRSAARQQAHGLRGSAATLGAVLVASLAGRLEQDASTADLETLLATTAELHGAVTQASQALRVIAARSRTHAT